MLDAAFGARSYPRLSFVALGPFSAGVIVEMNELPANFRSLNLSHAPDVWVIGCREHEEVVSLFKGFHSSVRGLVIAIHGRRGLQIYAPPNQRLTYE